MDKLDFIIMTNMQTIALVTSWGLTNYLTQKYKNMGDIVLFNKKLFGLINVKITGEILGKLSIICSVIVMYPNMFVFTKMYYNTC